MTTPTVTVTSRVVGDTLRVVTSVPLWSAIPAELRATEEDVTRGIFAEYYRDRAIQKLLNPACIAAAVTVARNAFHVPADSASTATGETPSPASPAQGTATHP